MRSLRYGINVTIDGCCDHTAGVPDEELHRFWADEISGADALTPVSRFLLDAGYWFFPKPFDLGGLFFDAMRASVRLRSSMGTPYLAA